MTPSFAADRPGRPAQSRLWAGRDDGDTGPVPIVGGRPGPPPGRPYDEPPTAAVAPFLDDEPTAALPPVVDAAPPAPGRPPRGRRPPPGRGGPGRRPPCGRRLGRRRGRDRRRGGRFRRAADDRTS